MTNDTASNPEIRLPWAGKNVRIEQIEEELALLWRMSADNMRTGQNINVRTSVLNLVICAPDIETAQRASMILRDLSSTHIARVTIVILDRSESTFSGISTWITLRCFSVISDVMRHCFEQSTILARGEANRSIASIIYPLLKPDLPVYLWWLGDPPTNDTSFSRLVELSNRVIVDSTSFFNPEQDVRTLASILQATPQCALSDLNWGRLTPWRQLVIQFFDTPEYRPYLAGIHHIEVEHSAAPIASPVRTDKGDVSPNPAQALLLAGWLKARLGWILGTSTSYHQHETASGLYHWRLERENKTAVKAKTNKQGIIDIRPRVQSDLRPGSICLVRLVSTVESKHATFTINRDGDFDHVLTSVEITQETRPRRNVNLTATHKESELLHDELEIMGHDSFFEQTLQEIATLLDR